MASSVKVQSTVDLELQSAIGNMRGDHQFCRAQRVSRCQITGLLSTLHSTRFAPYPMKQHPTLLSKVDQER
ncbi:hypothetical protein J1614_004477 [Plenodomus biglobosus]|nr:hypothetical protein J1614_004477 [Plenodomus biglobosus]